MAYGIEKREAVMADVHNGMKLGEITKKHGISGYTVRRWRRKLMGKLRVNGQARGFRARREPGKAIEVTPTHVPSLRETIREIVIEELRKALRA